MSFMGTPNQPFFPPAPRARHHREIGTPMTPAKPAQMPTLKCGFENWKYSVTHHASASSEKPTAAKTVTVRRLSVRICRLLMPLVQGISSSMKIAYPSNEPASTARSRLIDCQWKIGGGGQCPLWAKSGHARPGYPGTCALDARKVTFGTSAST